MNKTRIVADINTGLTTEQVEERKAQGLVNFNTEASTKSVKQIVRENVCTLFNMINIVLAIAVICVGSFKNLTFMMIIILNTLISIVQELRSKKTLDKLQVLASSKVTSIRDGEKVKLDINEIVLDDVLCFEIGNQVVVDSVIREGEVEVDESFITGEAETVFKNKGDMLVSGSFIVSGKATCQVVHIGLDNYTAKIASDTKYIKPISSEIMRSLNKIVSTISCLIVPVGILLFSRQMYLEGNTVSQAVVNTVAALIGMIPEGLVLLTSTVLAVSVIRLSRRKVLVQDLYCIETLARVDTICLDKTGTITEGCMEVVDTILKDSNVSLEEILANLNSSLDESNPTAKALKEKFGKKETFRLKEVIPFSSKKKYSGAIYEEGAYFFGAPEFLLKSKIKKYKDEIDMYAKDYRVLVLIQAKDKKLSGIKVLGYLLLQDKIRKEAFDTLRYFKEQGVRIKIISGDNPDTVYGIAVRAGLPRSCKKIDASTLKSDQEIIDAVEKYDIFGRVSPEQKKKFILALQSLGHTVAMTGDGVNDVLALKEADCSIAMANGSDASKNVSQLVLLDSNFSSMPHVVAEGRRTINNIERSASLFLVKTIYATILAIGFIFVEMPYPFIPIQLTLASVVTIGIPSFVLALQPNHDRVKGDFLTSVLRRAFPPAITIVLNIVVVFTASNILGFSYAETSTLSVAVTGYTSFILLYKTCLPLNPLRTVLFVTMFIAFIAGFSFRNLFSFAHFNVVMVLVIIICIIMSHHLYALIEDTENNVIDYLERRKKKKSRVS
jgi:cation-transporting ATPase E